LGIGEKLKKALSQKGMTVKELSEKSGVSLNTLYSITKRDSESINYNTIDKISRALNVPAAEFMSEKQIKEITEPTSKVAAAASAAIASIAGNVLNSNVQHAASAAIADMKNGLLGSEGNIAKTAAKVLLSMENNLKGEVIRNSSDNSISDDISNAYKKLCKLSDPDFKMVIDLINRLYEAEKGDPNAKTPGE